MRKSRERERGNKFSAKAPAETKERDVWYDALCVVCFVCVCGAFDSFVWRTEQRGEWNGY
jgi:hypothetical protein